MAATRNIDREVLGVVLLLIVVYSNTDAIIVGFFTALGRADSALLRVGVLVADIVVLAVAAWLKRAIGRADGTPGRLWRWWWGAAVAVCAFDIVHIAVSAGSLGTDLLVSMAFVIAMAILMMSSLNADPRTLFSARIRRRMPTDWERVRATVPLIVGSVAAYGGAMLWADYFNPTAVREVPADLVPEIARMSLVDQQTTLAQLCDEGINPTYFQHIAEVIPVLLLALGLEFNYFRRSMNQPVQRAAQVVTVTLMCVALVLALSTLPWDGNGCDDVLEPWHEYLAFTISLQAVFMALATVVWMLVVNTSPEAAEAERPAGGAG